MYKNNSFHFYIFAAKYFFMQITDWKQKAIERSLESKRLNKRIKELTISRNEWKGKAMNYKADAEKLSRDLKKIKDRLNEIIL